MCFAKTSYEMGMRWRDKSDSPRKTECRTVTARSEILQSLVKVETPLQPWDMSPENGSKDA